MKLKQVQNLHIPRCTQPPDFGRKIYISLVLQNMDMGDSYVRYLTKDGLVHCSLLHGKPRVSTKKIVSPLD